ncbi:MAG: prefoldin subunit [Promethearchaeota archaeon]
MQNQPQFTPQQQQEIIRFQQMQQQMEMFNQQLSAKELQLRDLDSSITELEKADEGAIIYKKIGALFIKKAKSDILESSMSEKESTELQTTSLKSSIKRFQAQFEEERKKIEEIFKAQGYKA